MQSRVNLGSKSTCIDIEQQIPQGVMDELPRLHCYILPPKRVETLLIKEDFSVSDISVFFYPSSPQNLSDNLPYSTLKRGRGESMGFNAISLKLRGKAQIIANF